MPRQRKRFIPNFDSLESRYVPAGNVTASFSGSLLTITGDNEANGISLTNNLDGTFTLDTTDGDTTFNGNLEPITVTPTSTAPFRVKINMKGGDDTVDIIGGDIFVKSDSFVKLGAGNDTLTMDGIRAGDDAKIDGEGGDDIIAVTNGGFDEDARILGGAGLDTITVDNVFFAEDAKVDGGSGDDTIGINNGRFYDEDASVLGGSGIDALTITASKFAKETTVDSGSGDDTVVLDDTVFGGKLRFNTGSGADLVTMTNTRVDYQSKFNLGSGDDEIQFGAESFFNKEASFDGGSNFDTFTHDGTNTWAKKHKVKGFELFQLGEVTPPGGLVTAVDDAAATTPSGTVTIDVLANDTTDSGGVLDPATVFVIADPLSGTATVNPDGTITYVNTSGTAGEDTFTYVVSDDLGNFSNEAIVTVTVSNEGELLANPDAATIDEGATITINVVNNDTTPAGTTIDPTTVQITFSPAFGTAVVNADGSITYSHDGSETTTDSLQYIFTNSAGNSPSPGTVTFTITPINDAPRSIDDAFTVNAGTQDVILDLAANDVDNEGLLNLGSIIIVTPPTEGTLTVNADGTVTYDSNGLTTATTDTFTYTIQDQEGLTSSPAGIVTITILGGGGGGA